MALPIVYHPSYVAPLPAGHRFPIAKFRQLYALLQAQGIARREWVHQPQKPPRAWLELVHDRDYVEAYCNGTLSERAQRRIGLPWSPALVERTQIAIGGGVLTARLALRYGLACNTAGGTHHAHPNYGSGFCIFNDLAVAARVAQQRGWARRIAIVDLDVHQGDGTAAIFRGNPNTFTFSMHCGVNFPSRKQASDCDVALPQGLDDRGYLQCLARYIPDWLSQVRPDLVLYDAGVDPHADDRLGKLALSEAGLYQRDWHVLSACLAAGYPVAGAIGGGYANDLASLARRHALLHRAASEAFRYYHL